MNKIILKPWGKEILLEKKRNYWIKKLFVRHGEKLSLQSHQERFEIWVVLSGKVEAIKGNSHFLLKAGDVFKVNKQEKHRIIGTRFIDSWILEIAFGRVRENDIVRFEDDYGRIKSVGDRVFH